MAVFSATFVETINILEPKLIGHKRLASPSRGHGGIAKFTEDFRVQFRDIDPEADIIKSFGDSITSVMTDPQSLARAHSESATDDFSTTIADSLSKGTNQVMSPDTITLAETFPNPSHGNRLTHSEDLTRFDEGVFTRAVSKLASDVTTLAEVFSPPVPSGPGTTPFSATETFTLSDTVSKRPNKPSLDTLALSESLSRQINKLVSSSLALSEGFDIHTQNRTFTTWDHFEMHEAGVGPVSPWGEAGWGSAGWGGLDADITVAVKGGFPPTINVTDTLALSDTRRVGVAKVLSELVYLTEAFLIGSAGPNKFFITWDHIPFAEPYDDGSVPWGVGGWGTAGWGGWDTNYTVAVKGTAAPTITKTDTLALADALARGVGKAAPDTMALSDFWIRAVSARHQDTVTIQDTVLKTPGAIRQDILALGDSTTRAISSFKTDTLALQDAMSRGLARQPLVDTLALVDIFDKKSTRGLGLSDTLALTEILTRRWLAQRSFLDTYNVTEIFNAVRQGQTAKAQAFTDTLTLSDVATRKLVRQPLLDTLTLSDLLAKGISASRSDTITVTESFNATSNGTKGRTSIDTFTLADVLARGIPFRVVESFTVTDSVNRSLVRVMVDALTLADVLGRGTGKGLGETLAISDLAARGVRASRSDTLAMAEAFAVTSNGAKAKTFTDTAALTDVLAKALSRNWLDSLALTDSLTTRVPGKVNFTETLALAEVFATKYIPVLRFMESYGVTDLATKGISRQLADSALVVDASTSVATGRRVVLTENLTVADLITRAITKVPVDVLVIGDGINWRFTLNVTDVQVVGEIFRWNLTSLQPYPVHIRCQMIWPVGITAVLGDVQIRGVL